MASKSIEKVELIELIKAGKRDITGCANILLAAKSLDGIVNVSASAAAGGNASKTKRVKSGLSELQERVLNVAYAVELVDLKVNRLDEYSFYANLEISKSFMHDDEFSSAFSTYLVE